MFILDKFRRGEPAVFRSFPVGGAASTSWIGAAFVAFVVGALASKAMLGVGISTLGAPTALLILIASAPALARYCKGIFGAGVSAKAPGEVDPYRFFASLAGGIVARMRADGRVLEVEANDNRDFGLGAEDLLGSGYFDKVHVADRPLFLQALSEAAYGQEIKAILVRLRRNALTCPNGERQLPSFARVEIRFRSVGASVGFDGACDVISVTRDITNLCELENKLEAAQREVELSKTLKDRLLANVSHELRTPLNAILGFSEILRNAELAPTDANKRMEYARIIHSSADHLLAVVNLVLDMSKIEAGKFAIVPESFFIEPLIKDCCDMLRLKAADGNVTLHIDAMIEKLELVADKRSCRQIILNLLSNAVKFTLPNGAVIVSAKREGDEIHFSVADTGIGIDSDHLANLGNPFYQVNSSYNRSFEGAGLGLSLVRGLVGLHGGSMLLETKCGVGTRVTVRLPIDCRSITSKASHATRLETVDCFKFPTVAAPDAPGSDEGERRFA